MSAPTLPPRSRPSDDMAAPPCPYVGLVPFDEKDTDYFFGRDRDAEMIVANLTAARLTLLYAPSGVGKSSVLRAGVIPRLRELASEDEDDELVIARSTVAYVSEWSSAPSETAATQIRRALGGQTAPDMLPPSSLSVAWLRDTMGRAGVAVLYLILDQFEEYLFYHPADTEHDELTDVLSTILTARDLDVHVLLSVREDALAGLDRFKGRIPQLFGNYLRLAHLTREAARSAIEGPVAMYNRHVASEHGVSVEPDLVDELLDQVRTGNVVVGRDDTVFGAGAVDRSYDIETPYLQLVLTRLWEEEPGRGSTSLRRQTLADLGGAQTIVQSHLDTVIAGLTPEQVEVAADVFRPLITASGSKIALTAADLADWSGQPIKLVEDLVESLSSGRRRILRPVPPAAGIAGPPRYEIFHDVMGAAVLEWRRRYVAERQQEMASRRLVAEREKAEAAARTAKRQLRLTLISVGLVVVLLAAIGFSWVYYRNSEQQQLLAEAAVALEQSPELSLHKAIEAFQLGDTASSRSALLKAVSSPRGHLVAGPGSQPHDMDVWGMEVTTDGEHVVAFDRNGKILVHNADGNADTETAVTGLSGRIVDVASAPDGSRVAVATDRSELTVVDIATGARLDVRASWQGSADIAWLGQATGGSLLVTSDTATIVDATTGAEKVLTGSVWWSADLDGQRVVTSTADAQLRVWDIRSGQQLAQSPAFSTAPTYLKPYNGSVVGISRNSSGDSEIVVWDWQSGKEPLRFPYYYANDVSDLDVDKVNGFVRIATDKEVWSTNLADGSFAGLLPQQPDWVSDIAHDPAGPWAATAGNDGRVLVWFTGGSVRPVQPTYELLAGGGGAQQVEFLHDGSLATMSLDGTLRQWAMPAPPRFTGHTNWVLDVDQSRDGQWLATASSDGYGHIVSFADVTQAVSWFGSGSGFALTAVRIDPSDPHRVFTLGRWSTVPQTWRWSESAPAHLEPVSFEQPPLRGGTSYLVSIGVSPDGTTVAAGDTDGTVHRWDARTGQALPGLGQPGRGYPAMDVAFDPTGALIATTARDGVRLIDVGTGAERVLDHPNSFRVDFAPSGSRVVSVADAGTVRIWTTDGGRMQELVGPTSRLGHASFSPDGALVAVGTATGLVEVWDVATGTTLARTRQHGDSVNDVLFVPGARYQLVTASDDWTVVAWDCSACDNPDAAIEAAEASLGTR